MSQDVGYSTKVMKKTISFCLLMLGVIFSQAGCVGARVSHLWRLQKGASFFDAMRLQERSGFSGADVIEDESSIRLGNVRWFYEDELLKRDKMVDFGRVQDKMGVRCTQCLVDVAGYHPHHDLMVISSSRLYGPYIKPRVQQIAKRIIYVFNEDGTFFRRLPWAFDADGATPPQWVGNKIFHIYFVRDGPKKGIYYYSIDPKTDEYYAIRNLIEDGKEYIRSFSSYGGGLVGVRFIAHPSRELLGLQYCVKWISGWDESYCLERVVAISNLEVIKKVFSKTVPPFSDMDIGWDENNFYVKERIYVKGTIYVNETITSKTMFYTFPINDILEWIRKE